MDISKIEVKQSSKFNTGSVGYVELITGTYENKDIKVVVKTQKKWERVGDLNSWRREYDLYTSDFEKIFTENFRWPKCYYAEINNDETETKLWLEYIEGDTNEDLTMEICEKISKELGYFHAKLYANKAKITVESLCHQDAMKNFYHYNRSKNGLYDFIRQTNNEIPPHLCKMIINMDEKADAIWAKIEKLPIVIRHGDFFPPNIFYLNNQVDSQSQVVSIDWDSAGWSYLGEDLVGFITETNDLDHMVELYQKCAPAYLNAFCQSLNSTVPQIKNLYIYERIIMHMGYRMIDKFDWRGLEKTASAQEFDMNVLQKIYEMGIKNKDSY